jgi:hypothetical protein
VAHLSADPLRPVRVHRTALGTGVLQPRGVAVAGTVVTLGTKKARSMAGLRPPTARRSRCYFALVTTSSTSRFVSASRLLLAAIASIALTDEETRTSSRRTSSAKLSMRRRRADRTSTALDLRRGIRATAVGGAAVPSSPKGGRRMVQVYVVSAVRLRRWAIRGLSKAHLEYSRSHPASLQPRLERRRWRLVELPTHARPGIDPRSDRSHHHEAPPRCPFSGGRLHRTE